MTPEDAIVFAIEKLEGEVDREFDGADLTIREQQHYARAIKTLKSILNETDQANLG